MKNRLFFRIIGALSSALIVVSVFVPFVKVKGYSTSLWLTYAKESMYLPIIIIVFGVLGILVFSLNKKTEFAYMSVGAILFFVIMNTVNIGIDNLKTLNIGYYFLVIGTFLTAIMTFLLNLKDKNINKVKELEPLQPESSMINKIDELYDNQVVSQDNSQIKQVDVGINPVNPINSEIQPIQPIESNQIEQSIQTPNPVIQDFNIPKQIQTTESNQIEQSIQTPNQVVQDFNGQQPVQQAGQQIEQELQQPNPVVQDFGAVKPVQPQVEQSVQNDSELKPNPVVQDFTNPKSSSQNNISNEQTMDIFGQPLN